MQRRPRRFRQYLPIVGAALLGFGLGFSLRLQAKAASAQKHLCQTMISSQTVLSRQQLAQLLSVPERENRQAIGTIAKDPYCTLAEMEVRAGVIAERAAYPLAFDPNTWLIVLYEDEEYVGYGFKFQH